MILQRASLEAEQELDSILLVPLRRAEKERLLVTPVEEHLLGEWRAIVGAAQLAADHPDRLL